MNIVITAGGTEEKIDSVRKITNTSTGKLGCSICNIFTDDWFNTQMIRNNHIFYICNKNSIKPDISSAVTIIETTDTASVEQSISSILNNNHIDFFIHSMAISDYTVEGAYVESHDESLSRLDTRRKMKSNNEEIYLKLIKTPKIIDTIKQIQPELSLISFKLLDNVSDEELIEVALNQLNRTTSSLVVANDLTKIRNGTHEAFMVQKLGVSKCSSKKQIAEYIKNYVDLSKV